MSVVVTDDAIRQQADAIARQGVLRDMPTAGWASLTATCPLCGVEVQTALEPERPYSRFEMTPMALAIGTLRHSLFGHLRAYHPEAVNTFTLTEAQYA